MEPDERPGGVERGVSAIDMDTPDFDRMESDLELAVERRQSMGSASGDTSPRSVSSTGTSSSFAEDARYQHLHELLLEREGDLIAAYDIGKKLLEKNKRLEQRVDELEEIQEEMDKDKVEMLMRLEKSGGEEGKAKDGEIARLQEQLKAAKEAEAKIHAQSEVTVAAVKDMGELIETQTEEIKSLEQQLLLAHQAMHESEREREEAERLLLEWQQRCGQLEEELDSLEKARATEVADTKAWAVAQTAKEGADVQDDLKGQLKDMEGRLASTMAAAEEDMRAMEQQLESSKRRLLEVEEEMFKAKLSSDAARKEAENARNGSEELEEVKRNLAVALARVAEAEEDAGQARQDAEVAKRAAADKAGGDAEQALAKVAALEKALADAMGRLVAADREVMSAEEVKAGLEKSLADALERATEAEREVASAVEEKAALKATMQLLDGNVGPLQEKVAGLEKETAGLEGEVAEARKRQAEVEKELAESEKMLEDAKDEIASKDASHMEALKELSGERTVNQEVMSSNIERQKQIKADVDEAKKAMKETAAKLRDDTLKVARSIDDLEAEMVSLRDRAEAAEKETAAAREAAEGEIAKLRSELHETEHKHEKASRAVAGGSGGALMPPYKVTVKVIGARDLPKMDTFGKCDAYVVLSAGEGQGGKTKKVDKSYDPDFGDEFEFEVRETDATLTVELFDWDKMSKDDLVGHLSVPIGRMIGGHAIEGTFRLLSGPGGEAVIGHSGRATTVMLSVVAEGESTVSAEGMRELALEASTEREERGALQKRVDSLEKELASTVQAEQQEKQALEAQAAELQAAVATELKEKKDLASEAANLKEVVANEQKERMVLKEEVERLHGELKGMSGSFEDAAKAETDEKDKAVTEAASLRVDLESKALALAAEREEKEKAVGEVAALQKEVESMAAAVKDFEGMTQALEGKVNDVVKERDVISKEKAEKDAEISELRDKYHKAVAAIEENKAVLVAAEEEKKGLKGQQDAARSEKAELLGRVQGLEQVVQRGKDTEASLRDEVKRLVGEMRRVEEENKAVYARGEEGKAAADKEIAEVRAALASEMGARVAAEEAITTLQTAMDGVREANKGVHRLESTRKEELEKANANIAELQGEVEKLKVESAKQEKEVQSKAEAWARERGGLMERAEGFEGELSRAKDALKKALSGLAMANKASKDIDLMDARCGEIETAVGSLGRAYQSVREGREAAIAVAGSLRSKVGALEADNLKYVQASESERSQREAAFAKEMSRLEAELSAEKSRLQAEVSDEKTRLETELSAERTTAQVALSVAAAKAAKLEKSNAEMAETVEKLRSELHETEHKHEKASRAVAGGSGGALMPPYKVTVKVIGARDLPKMDTFGKCDAYMVLSAGEGQGGKTKKVDKSYDPDFGDEFEFEVRETDATLTVELFDWDKMSKDDLVGHLSVPIGRMIGGHAIEGTFRLLSGPGGEAVIGHSGRATTVMLSVVAEGESTVSAEGMRELALEASTEREERGALQKRVDSLEKKLSTALESAEENARQADSARDASEALRAEVKRAEIAAREAAERKEEAEEARRHLAEKRDVEERLARAEQRLFERERQFADMWLALDSTAKAVSMSVDSAFAGAKEVVEGKGGEERVRRQASEQRFRAEISRLQGEAKELRATAEATAKKSANATSELREELRRLEGRLEEARSEAAKAKGEAAQAGGREGEWKAEKEGLIKRAVEAEVAAKKARKEAEREREEDAGRWKEERARATERAALLEGRLQELEARYREGIVSLKRRAEDAEDGVRELQGAVYDADKERLKWEAAKNKHEEEVRVLKALVDAGEEKIEEAEERVNAKEEERAEAARRLVSESGAWDEERRRRDEELEGHFAALQASQEAHRLLLESTDERIADLQAQADRAEGEGDALRRSLEKEQQEVRELREALDAARGDAAEAAGEREASLLEQISAMEALVKVQREEAHEAREAHERAIEARASEMTAEMQKERNEASEQRRKLEREVEKCKELIHEWEHKHERAARAVAGGAGGALMPPYKVILTVIGARDLPKMDMIGKCDAYVVLNIGEGQGGQTKRVDKEYDPDFGDEFEFEVCDIDAVLTAELFDYDMMSTDELVGHVSIPVGRMLSGHPIEGSFRLLSGPGGAAVMGQSGRVSTVLLRVRAQGDAILSVEGMRELEGEASSERDMREAAGKRLEEALVELESAREELRRVGAELTRAKADASGEGVAASKLSGQVDEERRMRLETVAELSRAKAEVASAQGSVEELERLLKDSRCRVVDLEAKLKAIESEKKNVDEAFTLAVDELAQYQEGVSDHEELVKRVEEAEKEIGEGKRREKSLAEELGRKDEEISRMRENAVEREKVMREVEIAVQKEKMAQGIEAKEKAVNVREGKMAVLEKEIAIKEEKLAVLERAVEAEKKRVERMEEEVAKRERAVDAMAKDGGKKEGLLEVQSRELDRRKGECDAKEAMVAERERAVEEKERVVARKDRDADAARRDNEKRSQELDVKERSVEASSKVAEQTKRERLAEIVKREGKLADAEKAVEEREAAARDALRSEREAVAKLDGLAERERACDERERLLESKRSEVAQKQRDLVMAPRVSGMMEAVAPERLVDGSRLNAQLEMMRKECALHDKESEELHCELLVLRRSYAQLCGEVVANTVGSDDVRASRMRKELEKKLAVARSSERAEIVAELQSAMVWARKRRSQLLETMAAPTPSEMTDDM